MYIIPPYEKPNLGTEQIETGDNAMTISLQGLNISYEASTFRLWQRKFCHFATPTTPILLPANPLSPRCERYFNLDPSGAKGISAKLKNRTSNAKLHPKATSRAALIRSPRWLVRSLSVISSSRPRT
jgi:hypothetical protein